MITRRPVSQPLVAALPLAALIDCVFLLLVYFMIAGTLEPQESDLLFTLPGRVAVGTHLPPAEIPVIELDAKGRAFVNGVAFDAVSSVRYLQLEAMLSRYAQLTRATRAEPGVLIAPHAQTPHQAIVRVLDACSAAGVEHLAFAVAE